LGGLRRRSSAAPFELLSAGRAQTTTEKAARWMKIMEIREPDADPPST
jgi:hypothetical protein